MKVFVFHGDKGVKEFIINYLYEKYKLLFIDYCGYIDGEICDFISPQKEVLKNLFSEDKIVLLNKLAFDELYFLKLIELNRFLFSETSLIKDNNELYNITSVSKIKTTVENKILQYL